MAVGYPKDKNTIDNTIGALALAASQVFRRAVQLKTELDVYTDVQLEGKGYTTGEVTQIRAMAADLVQLNGIFTGAATLGTVKDFRASLRFFFGVLGDN